MPVLRYFRRRESITQFRRVYFQCVQPDGKTPAIGEDGQQPQIMIDGTTEWQDDGIGVLHHCGNARYYAEIDQSVLAEFGTHTIETRYARDGYCLETPGDSVEVVPFKIGDEFSYGEIRAAGTTTHINVKDTFLVGGESFVGSTFVMISGNRRGQASKITAYDDTVGAKYFTLEKPLSSAGYAVGDLFMIIGA